MGHCPWYSFDGPDLLGTGGALRKALPLLGESFFVLYGDSYLPVDYREIAGVFSSSGKFGLMTVYNNEDQWDASNVWFEGGQIRLYSKKTRLPEMHHIDYGLGMLSPAAFEDFQGGGFCDLADILSNLVAKTQLAGHEVFKRFYEIGSPAGLQEMDALLSTIDNQTNTKLHLP